MGVDDVDLAEFVHMRGVALIRFAYGLCGDRALAEDLVQEALVRLFRRFGVRMRADSPEASARQVVVRQFLQDRRRRRVPTTDGPLPDLPSPDGARRSDLGEREVMWQLLAQLPAKQRAVLVLGYYEDLSDDEISRLMGCSPITVRTQRSRALAKLRAHPHLALVTAAEEER